MASVSKYIKLHPDILVQWIFDNEHNVQENYKVITNLQEDSKRNFLSTSRINKIENSLFQVDPTTRKYSRMDVSNFNFLKEQNYSSTPVPYDVVRVYFPTNYDFISEGYIGTYLKIFAYGYYNKKTYNFSNLFYDVTDPNMYTMMELAIPFIYDEQEWGKYIEFDIPSIDYVSNQRTITSQVNQPVPNSINGELTENGLSQTTPIFVDFHFITSKSTVLDIEYFYLGENRRTSFAKSPEYQTLAVVIDESTEGDFFEIYGTYGESNENLDDFVDEIETKGRRMRIEYDVYLYEENIQTSKQTFTVTDNFSQKIRYRPVILFSNTTAAIKVDMRIIDLIDMSQISRFSTYGIKDNVQKYGKKLLSINMNTANKLKIYNAKGDNVGLSSNYIATGKVTEIVRVPYPLLIDVGKIITNSPKSSGQYRGNGLLNIVITPFDNIIQFRLATLKNQNQLELYDLSKVLSDSDNLMLVFKSDTETIEKEIFKEADNDYKHGIVNYKINENDIGVLKKIYNKGYTNFYLALQANTIKTLMYSGTYVFYEDVKFVDDGKGIDDDGAINDSLPEEATDGGESTPAWIPQPGKTVIIYTKYRESTATELSTVSLM